jgi:hypothetical protein
MTIRNIRSIVFAGTLATIGVSTPVFATGPYHPANSEVGVTYHPEHASKTAREQVVAELSEAQKQRSWSASSRGAPWPIARTAEPRTRAQVNAELQQAMALPTWSAINRGAPWPSATLDGK